MARVIDIAMSLRDQFSPVLRNINRSIDSTRAALRSVNAANLSGLNQRLVDSHNITKRMAQELNNTSKTFTNMGKSMLPAAAGLTGGAAMATKSFANFNDIMLSVKAKCVDGKENFEMLNKKAKEMGASTRFSATEAAQGLDYFAMAGYTAKDSCAALGPTLALASATNTDLARTCDIVSDAMTAFGMEAGKTGQFADVLSAVTTKANTTVDLLGYSFKQCGALCGSLKYSIQDASLALGIMANAGIKGETAGMALKNVITNMLNPSKQQAIMMEKYGVSLKNADGSVKPLKQSLDELRAKTKGMTDAQKSNFAAVLAGKEGMAGLLSILNASDESYNQLNEKIKNSEGNAKRLQKMMDSGLGGSLAGMKSKIETLGISFGEVLAPTVVALADNLGRLVTWFDNLSPGAKKMIVVFGEIFIAMTISSLALGKLFGSLSKFSLLLSNIGKAGGIGKFISSNLAGFKVLGTGIKSMFKVILSLVTTLAKGIFYSLKLVAKGLMILAKTLVSGIKLVFKGFMIGIKGLWRGILAIGPMGWMIIGIITLIAVSAYFIIKYWKPIKAFFANLWQGVCEVTKAVWTVIKGIFAAVVSKIVGVFNKIGLAVKTVWVGIKSIIKSVFAFIVSFVAGALNNLCSNVKAIFNLVKNIIGIALKGAFNHVKITINMIKGVFEGITQFITGVFTGNWSQAWKGIVKIFTSIFGGIKGVCKNVMSSIKEAINAVIGKINGIKVSIPKWVPKYGGSQFSLHIPKLYKGTDYWLGGPAMIHDRGAEIVDLPRGSRVIPHDKSLKSEYNRGKAERANSNVNKYEFHFNIASLTAKDENSAKVFANEVIRELNRQLNSTAMNQKLAGG